MRSLGNNVIAATCCVRDSAMNRSCRKMYHCSRHCRCRARQAHGPKDGRLSIQITDRCRVGSGRSPTGACPTVLPAMPQTTSNLPPVLAVGYARDNDVGQPLPATRHGVPPFDELYVECSPMVWRLLLRMGVPEGDIEDAAQEVFCVVNRKLAGFEGRSTAKTWIYAIAMRTAKSWRRRDCVALTPNLLATNEQDAFARMVTLEGFDLFRAVVEQMDEDKREVFVLHEVEQLVPAEISEIVGANRFTVYTRLRAARSQFKKILARNKLQREARRR